MYLKLQKYILKTGLRLHSLKITSLNSQLYTLFVGWFMTRYLYLALVALKLTTVTRLA